MNYSSESKNTNRVQMRMSGHMDVSAGFCSDGKGELTITLSKGDVRAVFCLDRDAAMVVYDAICGYLSPKGIAGQIIDGGEAYAE